MEKFIKFGLVGVLNTAITIGIFNVLRFVGIDIIVANTIGYICGIVNSYFWNNRWVFKSNSKDIATACKFIVVNIGTMFINNCILILLAQKIGINEVIAQGASLGLTTVINFIGNKVWTFNK
ncbi:GtrA family protein [Clostridium gasigenes]|uniref:GtrA family protein n=1 Tax=Clostridium gasigenes TaxID=94869 RepID=UPI001C0E26FE|nr:GtrA family protein [Clostridium gasigenes]MBU3138236.1 GtrA family protein [Clostridium gasigenes]